MSITLSAYDALNDSMVQIIVNKLEWGYLNWGAKPLVARVPGIYSTGWYIIAVTDVYFNLQIILENDSYVSVQNNGLQLVITPPTIAEQFYFTYDTIPIDLYKTSWVEFTKKPLYIRSRANNQIISYIPTTDKYSYNYMTAAPNITIPSNVLIKFLEPNYIKRAWDSFTGDSSLVAGCCMYAYEDQTGSSMMYKKFCQTLDMYIDGTNSKGNNDISSAKCDMYMNQYCPVNLDSPYCGCYNADEEIKKLSPELQTYSAELKARPDCWLNSCKTGYNNIRSTEVCPIMNCLRLNTDPDVYQINGRAACYYGLDPIKTPKYVSPPATQIIDQINSSNTTNQTDNQTGNQTYGQTSGQTSGQTNSQTNTSSNTSPNPPLNTLPNTSSNTLSNTISQSFNIKTFLTNPFVILLFVLILVIAINSGKRDINYQSYYLNSNI